MALTLAPGSPEGPIAAKDQLAVGDNAAVTLPSNPADRLAVIMGNLRTQDPEQQIVVSFQNVLGVSASDEPEAFFQMFGRLQALPVQVAQAVQRYADPEFHNPDMYLRWVPSISTALIQARMLVERTRPVLAAYTDEDIERLRFCGPLLNRAKIEGKFDAEEFSLLRQQVEDLHAQILSSTGLPDDLKSYLLDQLDQLRYAGRSHVIAAALVSRIRVHKTPPWCITDRRPPGTLNSRAIHSVEQGQSSVRELEPQDDQRGDDLVGEYQLMIRSRTGRTQPAVASTLV